MSGLFYLESTVRICFFMDYSDWQTNNISNSDVEVIKP